MNPYKRFLNLSIRTKFIASLLLTSLASTSVVGVLAYSSLMKKFDVLVSEDASKRFSHDVRAYFQTYGSWEEGLTHENFRSFVERRHQFLGRPPIEPERPEGLEHPDAPDSAEGLNHVALRLPPHEVFRQRMPPEHPPQPDPGNLRRPPFRFYLFDTHGHSLTDLSPYRLGEAIHQPEKDSVLPISVNEHVVAYYSPHGQANYSEIDLAYLAAMRDALAYGVLAGTLLTLLLGLVFGNRISLDLSRLTKAAVAMGEGDLKQHIETNTHDEVGLLAKAFNRMSAELARNYNELHDSHQQIQQQADQLHELSMRDMLTGLYNRRYFDQQSEVMLKQALRYERPFSVMIGDIDYFKKINDKFSHAMGDEVLKQMGQIMASKLRETDLVARYGGEEFVIAFPETSLPMAQAICEALRTIIENHPWHELHPKLKVTMSMGLSAHADLDDVHAMLREADSQLYRAKSEGRNRVCSA